MILPQHRFAFNNQVDWVSILANTTTIDTYASKICHHAHDYSTLGREWSPDEISDRYNMFVGMAFEVFVEMLLKRHPGGNQTMISNYTPIAAHEPDVGVDGTGIGNNGRPAAVQCKFKSSLDGFLTANDDHLCNFVVAANHKYGVLVEDANNLLVVTTAKNIHPKTKTEMLHDKVRCIGIDHLRLLVNNDLPFWQEFTNAMVAIVNA